MSAKKRRWRVLPRAMVPRKYLHHRSTHVVPYCPCNTVPNSNVPTSASITQRMVVVHNCTTQVIAVLSNPKCICTSCIVTNPSPPQVLQTTFIGENVPAEAAGHAIEGKETPRFCATFRRRQARHQQVNHILQHLVATLPIMTEQDHTVGQTSAFRCHSMLAFRHWPHCPAVSESIW